MIDQKLYAKATQRIEAEFQEAARVAEVDRERDALAFLRAKEAYDLDLIVARLLYNTDNGQLEAALAEVGARLTEDQFSQLQTKLSAVL